MLRRLLTSLSFKLLTSCFEFIWDWTDFSLGIILASSLSFPFANAGFMGRLLAIMLSSRSPEDLLFLILLSFSTMSKKTLSLSYSLSLPNMIFDFSFLKKLLLLYCCWWFISLFLSFLAYFYLLFLTKEDLTYYTYLNSRLFLIFFC